MSKKYALFRKSRSFYSGKNFIKKFELEKLALLLLTKLPDPVSNFGGKPTEIGVREFRLQHWPVKGEDFRPFDESALYGKLSRRQFAVFTDNRTLNLAPPYAESDSSFDRFKIVIILKINFEKN